MRITLNLGLWRFSAGLLPSLAAIVVIPVMCSLGMWQFDRAQQKVEIRERYEARQSEEAIDYQIAKKDLHQLVFSEVTAKGRFQVEKQFLLDNQMQGAAAGYAVITPFETVQGDKVLVHRGWLPRGESRENLPAIDVVDSEQLIRGKLNKPGKAFSLGEMSYEQGWPLRIQYIDYQAMGDRLGYSVPEVLVMLNPEMPNGYLRNWQPVLEGPEKNYSYMGQWFAMASVVIILYIALNVRRREENE